MSRIHWDSIGSRRYETGIDRGVLYLINDEGEYDTGFPWNGLTTVTEKPDGAASNIQYADNIQYLNLISVEKFGCTIEAFTYPDQFLRLDGYATPHAGVLVGQQPRRQFGLSYRSLVGNDVEGTDYGYKVHLVYGCTASPSEKAFATVNDSPEAISLSWDVTTIPVPAGGDRKPTSLLTIDSSKVDPDALSDLEDLLYGTAGNAPQLPTPAVVIALFTPDTITVDPLDRPAFNSGTNTITIPTTTGVDYTVGGDVVPAGPLVITDNTMVVAVPQDGYRLTVGTDNDWYFEYTP